MTIDLLYIFGLSRCKISICWCWSQQFIISQCQDRRCYDKYEPWSLSALRIKPLEEVTEYDTMAHPSIWLLDKWATNPVVLITRSEPLEHGSPRVRPTKHCLLFVDHNVFFAKTSKDRGATDSWIFLWRLSQCWSRNQYAFWANCCWRCDAAWRVRQKGSSWFSSKLLS